MTRPSRVLAFVAAHPDDDILGAVAIVARHRHHPRFLFVPRHRRRGRPDRPRQRGNARHARCGAPRGGPRGVAGGRPHSRPPRVVRFPGRRPRGPAGGPAGWTRRRCLRRGAPGRRPVVRARRHHRSPRSHRRRAGGHPRHSCASRGTVGRGSVASFTPPYRRARSTGCDHSPGEWRRAAGANYFVQAWPAWTPGTPPLHDPFEDL